MAADAAATGAATEDAVAVLDRPEVDLETPAPAKDDKKRKKDKKKDDAGDIEYEAAFETPFGKLEFEFEPKESKERRDKARAEKSRKDAEKRAAAAAKKAERVASRPARGRGGNLLIVLLVLGLIAGAIALAIWLFARPGAEEEDAVPPEYRNEPEPAQAAAPQSFVERTRARVRDAVRAGRKASREAQEEQERRLQDLTSGRQA